MSEYETGSNLKINWALVVMYCLVGISAWYVAFFADYPGTWGRLISLIIFGFIVIATLVMVISVNVTRIMNRRNPRR